MPYTNRSLAFIWLVAFALFFLAGSQAVAGTWLLLAVMAALLAPAILLRNPALVPATSRERARIAADSRDPSWLESSCADLYRWEDEGGARRQGWS